MLPPWTTPEKPRKSGEHAFGRDPDADEKSLQLDVVLLLIGLAIAWLVAVAFFALLLESATPVVVGALLPIAAFLALRALRRRFRERS